MTYETAKTFCENFASENGVILKAQETTLGSKFLSLAVDNFGGTFLHLVFLPGGEVFNWYGCKDQKRVCDIYDLDNIAKSLLKRERAMRNETEISNLINQEYD